MRVTSVLALIVASYVTAAAIPPLYHTGERVKETKILQD